MKDIQSKLDQVENLQKNLKGLTENDNCKNLLENLCSGLEKFLGFDSASKGYTGQGIVYSDLDRLCDGVMGFLNGVLEGVKDDEAVKTYKDLTEITDYVQKSIGKGYGIEGFRNAVAMLQNGLMFYHESFDTLTSSVTNNLEKLSRNLSGDYKSGINDNQDIVNQLYSWRSTIKTIQSNVKTIEVEKTYKLDNVLKKEINAELKPVKMLVEHLKRVAENTGFESKVMAVDSEFRNKEDHVREQIRQQSAVLHGRLNNNFEEINRKIHVIGKVRDDELEHLLKLMRELVQISDSSYKAVKKLVFEYEKNIVKQLGVIDVMVNGIITDDISKQLQDVSSQISSQLDTLSRQVVILGGLAAEAQMELPQQLSNIESELSKEIELIKQQIISGITLCIKNILGEKIKNKLQWFTGKVAKNDNGDDGLLDLVVSGVHTFADKYSNKSNFEKDVLPIWIANILEAEPVRGYLDKYVGDNGIEKLKAPFNTRGNNGINAKLNEKIKEQMVLKLSDNVTEQATSILPSRPNESIADKLCDVQKLCSKFADELSGTLHPDKLKENGNIFSTLYRAIEGDVKKGTESPNSFHLINALHSLFPALVSAARHVAKELESFTDGGPINLGRNVISAIERVKQLGSTLEKEIQKTDRTHYDIADTLGKQMKDELGAAATKVNFNGSLNPLVNASATKGIEVLNAKINSIIRDKLDDISPSIRGLINRLKNPGNRVGNVRQLVDDLQGKIDNLKSSVSGTDAIANGYIKDQVSSVSQRVADLKLRVTAINEAIEKFDTALRDSLTNATNAVNTTRQQMSDRIDELEGQLTQTAKEAFATVKSAVQSMFAEGHKADLTALQGLVDKQKKAIRKLIDADKEIGLKGLLQAMYTDEGNEIKKLLLDSVSDGERFKKLCEKFNAYLRLIFTYITAQVTTTSASPSSASTKEVTKSLSNVQGAIDILLRNLTTSKHFDNIFVNNLQSLCNVLIKFMPSHFAGAPNPKLLDVIKRGMKTLYEQLDVAYVSAYSGDYWSKKDAQKYASVILSFLPIIYGDLGTVNNYCREEWKYHTVKETNGLNECLTRCGYASFANQDSKGGELILPLNNRRGQTIHAKLKPPLTGFTNEHLSTCSSNTSNIQTGFNMFDIIDCLIYHLKQYYNVCHLNLSKSKFHPSTIRGMLSWFGGLPYNSVFTKVNGHFKSLAAEETTQKDIRIKECLDNIPFYLTSVSYECNHLLTTIQGHGSGFGQAAYPYACNFLDNSQCFVYPSDISSLLDMLTEICARLLSSLYFLYSRCRTPSQVHGWRECWYGKSIDSFDWDCNKHSADAPNCQPKSPLQAHLMDGLPSCLPHKLTSVGCKAECNTCPKGSPGQQCMTPMGFWDLTDAATVFGTGKEISNLLKSFCGNADSPLPTLFRYLKTMNPSPPKNLGDMLSLYCQLFQEHNGKYMDNTALKKHLVDVTIPGCFPLPTFLHGDYPVSKLTDAVQNVYNSGSGHPKPTVKDAITPGHKDLLSLVTKSSCDSPNLCAPYLHPLCKNAYHTFPTKHANLYFSWCTYLAWEFWNLLDELLNAFKNMSCQAYGCSSCNCSSGKHGVCEANPTGPAKPTKPSCHCTSIVGCKGVLSLFNKYGLTFRIPGELTKNDNKRTCENFVKQMTKVLYDGHFSTLFEEIDKFIFAIRQPFIWLNVALWLLSFLYLLHIMVIRLDLLHIKSHLHSPSSHRIAAQSLLAAARVNKLGKVFYLQP
ncbi:hypothetical protein, conserved [Babesia bigemina]|uniref:C3H1-type domain-containing protein n=1 Tax=Babesia bigemina TaxID=5866 RepID=A0A061BKG6_BABBI|nr:hypothetical protein, conserved [Babesia bigemina]CDR71418.1 hypothetical protein, conserved [Babesia bigemina]|eukprot:XP_012770368.1 hypothetical protein, conserved [Babesia bigemina]